MSKPVTYEKLIGMLAQNYEEIEHSIASQIMLNVSNHGPTAGAYRENVWKSLFEMVIPKKYCVEQGVFIIDSYGNKSDEVDLAIFDEMYTPYIFNYGKIKFIPIEAVAAVVQCKSSKVDEIAVSGWIESIEKLMTSMDSVARMATFMKDNNQTKEKSATQTATRPIKILCAMVSEGTLLKFKEDFDIMLSVNRRKKKLFKYIKGEEDTLGKWNDSLNHALKDKEVGDDNVLKDEIDKRNKAKLPELSDRTYLLRNLKVGKKNGKGKTEENVLLSLIFQLNQLLMVINNPMLFPHRAYADRFNKILDGFKRGEEDGQQK